VCSKINRIIMGYYLDEVCSFSLIFYFKRISMEGNVMGFFGGKECVGVP
jgi:hypothetical protein